MNVSALVMYGFCCSKQEVERVIIIILVMTCCMAFFGRPLHLDREHSRSQARIEGGGLQFDICAFLCIEVTFWYIEVDAYLLEVPWSLVLLGVWRAQHCCLMEKFGRILCLFHVFF